MVQRRAINRGYLRSSRKEENGKIILQNKVINRGYMGNFREEENENNENRLEELRKTLHNNQYKKLYKLSGKQRIFGKFGRGRKLNLQEQSCKSVKNVGKKE